MKKRAVFWIIFFVLILLIFFMGNLVINGHAFWSNLFGQGENQESGGASFDNGFHGSGKNFLPPGDWELQWSDEFDGTTIDENKWNIWDGWKNRDGWLNEANVYLDGDGHLVLATTYDPNSDKYFSGGMDTKNLFETRYGYFEARVFFPKKDGHWPAFWLNAQSMPKIENVGRDGAEIDVVEYPWRRKNQIHQAVHADGYGAQHKSIGKDVVVDGLDEGWHVFGMEWSPNKYVFYVDGKETWRVENKDWVSIRKEYLLLTDEIGEIPGWCKKINKDDLPDYTLVDYVRVYKKKPTQPKVCQLWGNTEGPVWDDMTSEENISAHYLSIKGTWTLKFRWSGPEDIYRDRSTTMHNLQGGSDLSEMRKFVKKIKDINPNTKIIVSIPYRDGWWNPGKTHWWEDPSLPENDPFWLKDKNGKRIAGWGEDENGDKKLEEGEIDTYLYDFTREDLQDVVAGKAKALSDSGLVDGIFLDWWSETWPTSYSALGGGPYLTLEQEREARLKLIKKIRSKVRDDFLIIVNANDGKLPLTGKYVDGVFMECALNPRDAEYSDEYLKDIEDALYWNSENLRSKGLTCVEGWRTVDWNLWSKERQVWERKTPENLRLMRMFTTMSLTLSDGGTLFSDRNQEKTPDHIHDWYDFWDIDLGKPMSPKKQLWNGIDRLYYRYFENGLVIYNKGNAKELDIPCQYSPVTHEMEFNGKYKIDKRDGEIFLLYDKDGDGYDTKGRCGPADCDDNNANIYPGADEICNNKDDDCDGIIDDFLEPCYTGPVGTLGVGECKYGAEKCTAGLWGDCSGQVLPSDEICDGKDNDCDGKVDEDLSKKCYNGPSGTKGIGECKGGEQICSDGKWGDCSGQVLPSDEICDGKDNDCDGKVDEDLSRATTCGVGECSGNKGIETCSAGLWGGDTCDPFKGAKTEICDGKDNDCDGTIDEGCECTPPAKKECGPSQGNVGECKMGEQTCTSSGWGKCEGAVYPKTEVCGNNKDDDCDGKVDEGCCEDKDKDGYKIKLNKDANCGTLDCDDNDKNIHPGAKEVCDDKKDNDCDGKTDCADSDCSSASNCKKGYVCGDGKCEKDKGESCSNCAKDCGSCNSGSCFPAGTKISMADGSEKNIENIAVGDLVESYDLSSGKIVEGVVEEFESPVREHLCEIDFSDGTNLKLTNEHPVYVIGEGWKSISPEETEKENADLNVEKLEIGDEVYSVEGGKVVEEINCCPEEIQTYNLKKIKGFNDYFADGILVHNKGGGGYCGDGKCNGKETCSSCPKDCGKCKGNKTNQGGNNSVNFKLNPSLKKDFVILKNGTIKINFNGSDYNLGLKSASGGRVLVRFNRRDYVLGLFGEAKLDLDSDSFSDVKIKYLADYGAKARFSIEGIKRKAKIKPKPKKKYESSLIWRLVDWMILLILLVGVAIAVRALYRGYEEYQKKKRRREQARVLRELRKKK